MGLIGIPGVITSPRSVLTLCLYHWMSLQFLPWPFDGALPRCMSGSWRAACEDRDTLAMSPSRLPHNIESRRDCREAQASFRKRKCTKWPMEDVDLLQKLNPDDSQSWSDMTRLFSEQFLGRSQGSIQFSDVTCGDLLPWLWCYLYL